MQIKRKEDPMENRYIGFHIRTTTTTTTKKKKRVNIRIQVTFLQIFRVLAILIVNDAQLNKSI